ncbi:MAG: gliding motility-associated C-terminal domain-containing protein, partial [Bacteroidota bacterium]
WTVPAGATIIGPDDEANIQIQWGTSSGTLQVEVSDNNNSDCNCRWTCSTDIPALPVRVNVDPLQSTTLPTVYICEGESYEYCGSFYSTTTDARCGDDCLSAVIQPIVVLPVDYEDLGVIPVCEGDCYTLGDTTICDPGFHTITTVTTDGCERKGFELQTIALDAFYNPSGVLNPRDSVVILLGGGNSNGGSIRYDWDGPGVLPGQDQLQNPEVNAAGPYIVTITDEDSGCTTQFTVIVQYQQDPCNLPAPPADSCSTAPLFCGSSLDGYCSSTGGYSPTVPGNLASVFCESIDNNQWLRFTPCLSDVRFSIEVTDCQLGNGIEAVILSANDCDQFQLRSDCQRPLTGETLELSASGLVPGDLYYIMVDGQQGADCDWTLEIIDGISTEPIVLQQTTEPQITGPDRVCPGEVVRYTAIPSDCSITGGDGCPYNELLDSLLIEWELPAGAELLSGAGTLEIEVRWPEGSSGSLVANISSALSEDNSFCSAQNNCGSYVSMPVNVDYKTTFLQPVTICRGDSYNYCGVDYFETIDAVCGDACERTVQPIIVQDPVVTDLGVQTICKGSCFDYEGQTYCEAKSYELERQNGPCKDIVKFEVVFETEAELSISEVIEDCDIFGNTYQVVFDITGGVPPYFVNGKLQFETTFNSGPILNGVVYNFEVTHSAECSDTTIVLNGTRNCTCLTDAGTMSDELLVSCEIGSVTGTHFKDEYLDANDAFEFILHKGEGSELVEPLAINFSGTFEFLDDQMQFGETYYISAVAGNAIDGGFVDLNAVCLSVAAGQPVVWYPRPIASLPPDGFIDCNEPVLPVTGEVAFNNPNVVLRWLSPNGTTQEGTTLDIEAAGSYQFMALDTLTGCETSATINVVADFDPPLVESRGGIITCVEPAVELRVIQALSSEALEIAWSSPSGEQLTGSNPSVSIPGNYRLLARGANGCVAELSASVTDGTRYPIIAAEADSITCSISAARLIAESNLSEVSYLWEGPNGFTSLKPITETSQQGVYNLTVTELSSGCISDTLLQVVENKIRPEAQIGSAPDFTCSRREIQLDASATEAGSGISYQWRALNNSPILNDNSLRPTMTLPDTYTLEARNAANGCVGTATIVLKENEKLPREIDLQASPPICHGDSNGVIFINETVGGVPPFLYAFEEGEYALRQSWLRLPPGEYSLRVLDANGCELEQLVSLPNPPKVEVSLPQEYVITLGESVLLEPSFSLPLNDIAQLVWQSAFGESLLDETTWTVQPVRTTDYKLRIADANNCMAEATTRVLVEKDRPVFVPKAFSPNGDRTNDVLYVHGGAAATRVQRWQIFDRWGTLIYEALDLPLNDAGFSWDGRFRGQMMN